MQTQVLERKEGHGEAKGLNRSSTAHRESVQVQMHVALAQEWTQQGQPNGVGGDRRIQRQRIVGEAMEHWRA